MTEPWPDSAICDRIIRHWSGPPTSCCLREGHPGDHEDSDGYRIREEEAANRDKNAIGKWGEP